MMVNILQLLSKTAGGFQFGHVVNDSYLLDNNERKTRICMHTTNMNEWCLIIRNMNNF